MKFRKQKFGGMRPVCTGSPALSVSGGFNLDIVNVKYPIGAVIPEASLAQYDEILRKVVVLKASRVVAINATDAKKVSLECDEYLTPIFMVNDHVAKDETGNFEDTASIEEIKHDRNGYVITLSKEITGLKVGDALFEVMAGSVEGEGKARLFSRLTPHRELLTLRNSRVGLSVGTRRVLMSRRTLRGRISTKDVSRLSRRSLLRGTALRQTQYQFTVINQGSLKPFYIYDI